MGIRQGARRIVQKSDGKSREYGLYSPISLTHRQLGGLFPPIVLPFPSCLLRFLGTLITGRVLEVCSFRPRGICLEYPSLSPSQHRRTQCEAHHAKEQQKHQAQRRSVSCGDAARASEIAGRRHFRPASMHGHFKPCLHARIQGASESCGSAGTRFFGKIAGFRH